VIEPIMRWDERWAVAGIEVPLPPGRRDDGDDPVPVRGEWARAFACADFDPAEAAIIWDRWAADLGLRSVSTLDREDALYRVWSSIDEDLSVTISTAAVQGSPFKVYIGIARRTALPRFVVAGAHVEGLAVRVPVPENAEPDVHEDLSSIGGEDTYVFRVRAFSRAALREIYLPWASKHGFALRECVEDETSSALFFRNDREIDVNIYWDGQRDGLRIGFKRSENEYV
jgi:hypothetical protein